MSTDYVPKNSGEKQEFSTGAQRDTQHGKGRFDLIPPFAILSVSEKYAIMGKSSEPNKLSTVLNNLYLCLYKDNSNVFDHCSIAICFLLDEMESRNGETKPVVISKTGFGHRFDLIPYEPIKRVAQIYESGANLYGERNWEKGMPLTRLLDSAIRHTFKYIFGMDDEDHVAQAIWNIMGFMEILHRINNCYLPSELDNRIVLEKVS